MQEKYTVLLTLAPAGAGAVPSDATWLAFNTLNNAIREFPAGRAIRPEDRQPNTNIYSIQNAAFETRFAVMNAILCTKPNGVEARPGMTLNLRFSYINSLGIQKFLLLYKTRMGRVPECITIEDVHTMLHEEIRSICATAATEFAHSVTLPYAHWWNEIKYNTKYRDMISTRLMQLFMSYGLMLDQESLAIGSLAQITVA
ncbi:MAG: hypothetical protein IJE07_06900 [Clostridia bacterium]|nr:hypothetical protein [Clostridia bacterium]